MGRIRRPFQGVGNIVRFNWHYYMLSMVAIVALFLISKQVDTAMHTSAIVIAWAIIVVNIISLSVSLYIYDLSSLYQFTWLRHLSIGPGIININAGFDETSSIIKNVYPDCDLRVFDFYDPSKHTEVSIKRARKAYPPFPGTKKVITTSLPLQDNSTDSVFAILSAHEIRNEAERIGFFRELNRSLVPGGQIIVTEHLRDIPNFLAYNIGFLHFHSRATWFRTFKHAGLEVTQELKITPFITTFILAKNGTAS